MHIINHPDPDQQFVDHLRNIPLDIKPTQPTMMNVQLI